MFSKGKNKKIKNENKKSKYYFLYKNPWKYNTPKIVHKWKLCQKTWPTVCHTGTEDHFNDATVVLYRKRNSSITTVILQSSTTQDFYVVFLQMVFGLTGGAVGFIRAIPTVHLVITFGGQRKTWCIVTALKLVWATFCVVKVLTNQHMFITQQNK